MRPTVLLFAVLLSVAGCTSYHDESNTTQMAGTAGDHLNCPTNTKPADRRPVQRYDFGHDGSVETVADLVCGRNDVPDQVEVFRDGKRLARLSTIAADGPDAEIFLARGCIYLTADRVVLVGHMRLAGAGSGAPPSVLAYQISVWGKNGLTPGKFTPMPDGSALPPGCG
jgi:hypothetical protein